MTPTSFLIGLAAMIDLMVGRAGWYIRLKAGGQALRNRLFPGRGQVEVRGLDGEWVNLAKQAPERRERWAGEVIGWLWWGPPLVVILFVTVASCAHHLR